MVSKMEKELIITEYQGRLFVGLDSI